MSVRTGEPLPRNQMDASYLLSVVVDGAAVRWRVMDGRTYADVGGTRRTLAA